jgi:hypothetical protein
MLRYALDEGFPIPATLAETITRIDHFLVSAGRRPLSEVPRAVIASAEAGSPPTPSAGEPPVIGAPETGPSPTQLTGNPAVVAPAESEPAPAPATGEPPVIAPAESERAPRTSTGEPPVIAPVNPAPAPTQSTGKPLSINEVILQAHNSLSNLVAPATSQSLRATDPAIVLFGLPPIAKFAIVGAIVCTVAFLAAVSKPISGILTDTTSKPQTAATPKVAATSSPAATSSSAVATPSVTPATP